MRLSDRTKRMSLFVVVLLLLEGTFGQFVLAQDLPSQNVAEWVNQLIKAEQLTVEYYDPAKPPKPFPGWTDFEFRLNYQYDYRMDWTQKKGGRVAVVVVPKYLKLDVPIKHHIQLPQTLKAERWYEAGLARHELEHVRVGMHPRLEMLGKHLISKVQRIEGMVDRPDDVTLQWVKTRVDAEMAARRDAVLALVLGINQKIDKSTNHGATELADRETFFSELYLKESLDQMKFPYLGQVLDLIAKPDYQKARVQLQQFDRPEPPK